ncbi:MAG: hypothetical protein WCL01_05755 [Comamonadaceae bacterium]
MVKVRGPLMSLAASGVWDGSIEFRSGNGKTMAAGIRKRKPVRSAAQLAQSAKFSQAIETWRGLDTGTRQAWKTASQLTGLNGYQFFLAEYSAQHINPPDLPIVP